MQAPVGEHDAGEKFQPEHRPDQPGRQLEMETGALIEARFEDWPGIGDEKQDGEERHGKHRSRLPTGESLSVTVPLPLCSLTVRTVMIRQRLAASDVAERLGRVRIAVDWEHHDGTVGDACQRSVAEHTRDAGSMGTPPPCR